MHSKNYVQSYILNLSFTDDYDHFMKCVEDGWCFNVEDLLMTLEESPNQVIEYTAPRWIKDGDIVFLMQAVSTKVRISKMYNTFIKNRKKYSPELQEEVVHRIEIMKEIEKLYGGTIFAIGRVKGSLLKNDKLSEHAHWKGNIFAPIGDIFFLDFPVLHEKFKEVIMVNRSGSITPVTGSQYNQLKKMISTFNSVSDYFENSFAIPYYLRDINKDNWMEVGNMYRRHFFLENQFRVFYVDYFLRILGDTRTFYKECRCVSDISRNARVDNVIRFAGKYLMVEVKLDILSENDLRGQLTKYCDLEYCIIDTKLDHRVLPDNIYNENVLVLDTNNVYLYNNKEKSILNIISLDDLSCRGDIVSLREIIAKNLL